MRIEDIRACEAIMRDVPKMSASLVSMERASQPCLVGGERVQGGISLPTAVRLTENNVYSKVTDTLDAVNDAMRELDDGDKNIVIAVYFLGLRHEDAAVQLGMNRRTVTRRCRDAIERIAPKVLPMYGNVIEWRERWDRSIVLAWTKKI